jgi:hypothetical protein
MMRSTMGCAAAARSHGSFERGVKSTAAPQNGTFLPAIQMRLGALQPSVVGNNVVDARPEGCHRTAVPLTSWTSKINLCL